MPSCCNALTVTPATLSTWLSFETAHNGIAITPPAWRASSQPHRCTSQLTPHALTRPAGARPRRSPRAPRRAAAAAAGGVRHRRRHQLQPVEALRGGGGQAALARLGALRAAPAAVRNQLAGQGCTCLGPLARDALPGGWAAADRWGHRHWQPAELCCHAGAALIQGPPGNKAAQCKVCVMPCT
jgi:hypothetical protein